MSKELFGIEIESSDTCWDCCKNNLTEYGIRQYIKLHDDGSITSDNESDTSEPCENCGCEDFGLEAVFARPMSYIEILENGIIEKTCQAIRNADGHANDSCGLHIHYNVNDWRLKDVRRLYINFLRVYPAIKDIFNISQRRIDNFCKETTKFRDIKNFCKFIKLDKRTKYKHGFDRYYAFNVEAMLKHGSIEYRMFNGSTDAIRIKTCLKIVQRLGMYTKKHEKIGRFSYVFDIESYASMFNKFCNLFDLSIEQRKNIYTPFKKRAGNKGMESYKLTQFNDGIVRVLP